MWSIVWVPLTSNVKWVAAPGNVLLSPSATGLSKESVANVSQVVTLDKTALAERAGKATKAQARTTAFGDRCPPWALKSRPTCRCKCRLPVALAV